MQEFLKNNQFANLHIFKAILYELITTVGEMRPGYAHSLLGVDISPSASVSEGSVSLEFTGGLLVDWENFIAPPITLHMT